MYYVMEKGPVVDQMYKVEATSWREAKRAAWDRLNEGDCLVECDPEDIETLYGCYQTIDPEKCLQYACLMCGAWINTNNGEDFVRNVWYFSDEPETLFNSSMEEVEQ